MKKVDIVVVGGGPAGLMAAIQAAAKGCSVVLLEKNKDNGVKLLITGKGRCNITNAKQWSEFSNNIYPDASFFKTAFYSFSNTDLISFFNNAGLETVCERGDRVYPATNLSRSVRDTLIKSCLKEGVEIVNRARVVSVIKEADMFEVKYLIGPEVGGDLSSSIVAKSVIVATGGLSYPSTGSTGDGYEFAKHFGHTIIETMPSLTALKPKDYIPQSQAILLKNVKLNLIVNGNEVQSEFGELQFTDGGIEGAIGFKLSRRAVKALRKNDKVVLSLDLKPALSKEQLNDRIRREMAESKKKPLPVLLRSFLPSSIIVPFLNSNKNINTDNLATYLKNWKFDIVDCVGYERCVITSGGIPLKELSRKTMSSKLIPGLYFAGEIVDLDAATGGYNLQIAFSTAHLAATSAATYVNR